MRRLIICLVAVAFVSTADGTPQSAVSYADRPLYGGAILRIADPAAADAVPGKARSRLEREAASLTGLRLLRKAADGSFEGEAVEEWKLSADRLELTLKLRSGLRDGLGRELTASDVVSSLHDLLRSNPESAAAGILLDLQGAELFVRAEAERVVGLVAVDERTAVLKLARRQPLLLDALADINAGPAPAGSDLGPFYRDEGGEFEPNLNFFRGRPYLDHLFFGNSLVIDENWRRPVLARVGDDQGIGRDVVEIAYPGRRCVYLVANRKGGGIAGAPLQDAETRRAALAAVDVRSLVSIFLSEKAEMLEHLVPDSALPGTVIGEIPAWSGGRKPVRRLAIGYPEGSDELALVAERIRVDLLVAGISSEVVPCKRGTAGRCDLLLVELLVPDGSPAYAYWGLLCELATECSDDTWLRRPVGDGLSWLAELERELRSEALVLPLYHEPHSAWADSRVRDLRFRPDGSLDFENAWIAFSEAEAAEARP